VWRTSGREGSVEVENFRLGDIVEWCSSGTVNILILTDGGLNTFKYRRMPDQNSSEVGC
jgi:hypothetical protein